MKERLQKLMAQAGLGSRRACEAIIQAGRVRVNGRLATLGDKADPDVDRIEVDGQRLQPQMPVYIMLNKPRNVITSLEDELGEGRTTVRDLIDLPGHLYPVGRLDKQSEGLILMTNDGELAHKLTHPRYEHEKVYRALIEGQLTGAELRQWRDGLLLDGQMTAPADISIISQQKDHSWLKIVLREGRKRQIRRVAAQLGHPVLRLLREELGPLKLGDLKPGQWRYLAKEEIGALRRTVGTSKPRVGRKRTGKQKRGRPKGDK